MSSYNAASSLFRKSNGHEPDTMQRMQSAVTTVNMGVQDLGKFRSDMPGPNIIGRYTGTKHAARVAMLDLVFTLRDGTEDGFTDVASQAIGFSNFAGLNTKGRTIDKMVDAIRWVGVAQSDSDRDVEDGATGNVAVAASGGISFNNNGPDNMAIGTGLRYVVAPADPQEKFAFDKMRTGQIVAGRDTAIVRAYEPTDLIFMWKESADILMERGQYLSVPDMVKRQTKGMAYGRGETTADYQAAMLKEFVNVCAFIGVVQACERGIVTPATISTDGKNNAKLYRNATARRELLALSNRMAQQNTDKTRKVGGIRYDATASAFKTIDVTGADERELQRAMTDFYRYLAASYNVIAEENATPENFVLTSLTQKMVLGFASKKLGNATLAHKLFDTALGSSPSIRFASSARPSAQLSFTTDADTTDDLIRRTIQGTFSRFMRSVGYSYNVEQAQCIGVSLSNTDAGNMLEALVRGG